MTLRTLDARAFSRIVVKSLAKLLLNSIFTARFLRCGRFLRASLPVFLALHQLLARGPPLRELLRQFLERKLDTPHSKEDLQPFRRSSLRIRRALDECPHGPDSDCSRSTRQISQPPPNDREAVVRSF